jgi:hypothetical protein
MTIDVDKDIHAWDLYAAAAITAIASRGPIDADALAKEAKHYADAMLELSRVKRTLLYAESRDS